MLSSEDAELMLVYIALFVFVLSVGLFQYSSITTINIRSNKNHYITGPHIVFCFVLISVTFIEAMRAASVGEDLPGYLSWFRYYRMRALNIETLLDFSAFEPGFMLLYKGIGLFSTTDHAFIVATSVIIVFLNMYFLYKNSEDFYLSVLLFFAFNHFFTSMVSLRQYIAIGIIMWILPSLKEKKYVRAVALGVVAFFFHMTSIIASIFIFAAFIVRKKKKIIPWVSLVAILIIPIAGRLFTFFTGFFTKYQLFYSLGSGGRIGSLRLIYILLEVALIFYVYFVKESEEEYTEYSLLLIPAIACGVLTSIPHIFRVGYYFDYVMLLLIPKIVTDSKRNKTAMRIAVMLIAIVFFAYYLSVNPGETVPYKFY